MILFYKSFLKQENFKKLTFFLFNYNLLLKNFTTLFLIFTFKSALAFVPESYLPEPQEQRARELFVQINCPVCAGQTIDSSSTEISFELKKLVREQISAGKSDDEIKANLVAKYGDNILNSDPLNFSNFWLWLLPLAFFVLGLFFLIKKHKISNELSKIN